MIIKRRKTLSNIVFTVEHLKSFDLCDSRSRANFLQNTFFNTAHFFGNYKTILQKSFNFYLLFYYFFKLTDPDLIIHSTKSSFQSLVAMIQVHPLKSNLVYRNLS
jgi:hypothetical protein